MSNILNRIDKLTPEQKAILEKRLREKALQKANDNSIPARKDLSKFPMTNEQKRLWFLHKLNSNSSSYNMPAAIKIKGKLNYDALERSFKEIIKRHQIFNVVFTDSSFGPIQNINKKEFRLQVVTGISENILLEILTEEANKPFSLAEGSLYRIKIINLSDEENILLITLHHIIADGWSVEIIINELITFYNGFANDQNIEPAALRIQYFDYAEWRNNYLNAEYIKKHLQYWKNKLNGMPQFLEISHDKIRPINSIQSGGRIKIELNDTFHKKLTEIVSSIDISPFMIYLAILEIVLYRFTNQEDFGIGIPVNGRENSDLKNLVGFFVNTSVIRAEISGEQSFIDHIKKVKETVIESFDHNQLPFEILVEELVKDKKLNFSPLFQVMYDYQISPLKKVKTNDLSIEQLNQDVRNAKFDLLFIVENTTDQIELSIEYNSEIFNADTIISLGNVFERIIHSIINNPSEKINLLKIISEDEEIKISQTWNTTSTDYPKKLSIASIFEEYAQTSPNSIAICFNDKKITYDELNKISNKLASYLVKIGVNPGSKIAILMDRSIDLVVVTLSILKSGAVYIPIDSSYPKDRIQFMLDDVNADFIITNNANKKINNDLNSFVINYDEISENISHENDENIGLEINSNSLAYIMYTSGSTGKPKGVMIPQKGIVRLVKNTNYIKISSEARIAQLANTSFDAATFEIWGSLLNGACLVIVPRDIVFNDKLLPEFLVENKISILFLTTALFNQIINFNPNAFSSIEYLLFGGEKVNVDSVKLILKNNKPKSLLNVYGPTENTTFTTYYEINEVEKDCKTIPIGKAISNSAVYILDKNKHIVPVGIPGELYIGGDGLSLGYFNRDEINKTAFIQNPYSELNHDKLYKTGDLVKYKSNGNIDFLDRIDKQVKLRGFRIELGEIESELKKIEAIKEAVVIVEGEDSISKQLIGYYSIKDNTSISSNDILRTLSKSLPEYMIPFKFYKVESIPLNSNGKIDKAALFNLRIEETKNEIKYEAPRTNFEKFLAELWIEILKIDKVSIHDNFFALGGNSLQAAVFTNRLQKEINTEVQVQSIFLAPTIYEFSNFAYEYYKDIIVNKFNEKESKISKEFKLEHNEKLSNEKIEEFNSIVRIKSQEGKINSAKNKEVVFILSPPRSGSTLLRVMLEGHDKLFSPPELDLLTYDSLAERKEKLTKEYNLWLEATIRAIMELKDCDVKEAEKIMDSFESKNMSVKEFYSQLQNWAGDKLLVDKTPTYAFDINILRRAEEYFESPKYIHLIRHPYASIYSFIEAKLDQNFFRHKHNYTRIELAELIWMTSHKNILEFLNDIPNERKVKIKFEDLVIDSTREMKRIADFLAIEFDEKLVNPYQGKRMTDPAKENSQMVGDFKFFLRNKIDPNVSNRWKNYHKENFLSDTSINVAKDLGYELNNENNIDSANTINEISEIKIIARDQNIPLSFAQQRLWFLDQLEPGNSAYNIPSSVELKGKIDFELIEKCINIIIERHESFRTYFKSEDGKPFQIILPQLFVKLELLEIDAIKNDFNQNINAYIEQESSIKFNLEEAPLFRIKLFKISEDHHILYLNMHHIISDGWSLDIFVKEFTTLYDSLLNKTESNLYKVEFQYADYSVWQRELLQKATVAKKINYWKKQLEDSPKLLSLPTDFVRPSVQRLKGKRIQFIVDPEVAELLQQFAVKENLTLNILFLSAFKILLHKYSASNDILVGSPVAGRNQLELQKIIGLFVNTIVLRTKFPKNLTIKELLFRVNHNLIEALNNQEIPFEKLVDELKIDRSLSHSPLFQVMFVFNNSPFSNIEIGDLKIQPQNVDLKISKFDLNLVITKRNNKLTGVFEYDIDLFREDTILLMIEHYLEIIRNILQNTSQKIIELQFITDSEKIRLLKSLDKIKDTANNNNTLPKLFEENFIHYENKISVIHKQSVITFSELNKKANRLANYLIKKGIKNESIVIVCLERSLESIISILGIWKAGGIYLPVDPSYPIDRLNFMIENSNASAIITEKYISEFRETDTLKIFYSDELEFIEKEKFHNPNVEILPENIAYIIFTSGSTGLPKGVMIQHRTALNLANGLHDKIYRSQNYNISLNAPLSFDASMQQIVMLLFGNTLTIIPEEIRLDGNAFINYINDKKIEILDCVPTQLKILIESGLIKDSSIYPSIILPGGEPISLEIWNKLKSNQSLRSFNMYGPTECSVDSTICEITESSEKPNIGKPINNSIHYILDENLNLTPAGIPGELFIGGDCLARGYLNNPALTAERFIPDPFSYYSGSRIYKTGDLVRLQNDGNIEYLGRLDEQVKIRGFRIELGEIENNLRTHHKIKDAVILIREDDPGIKKLVAYYIAAEKDEIAVSELKKHLADKLPDYMIPNLFMRLETFPLLPNKKINRKGFPKPEFKREATDSDFLAPSNEIENSLLEIWKDVLKISNIGVNDNFFELGGDSILAIQIISKANKVGLKITPKNIFQSPTIKGLSLLVGTANVNIENREIEKSGFDLSPIQNWFFNENFQNKNHWNQSLLFEVSEPFNEENLKEAFNIIYEQHDALRLRFSKVNSKWMQTYSNYDNDCPFEIEYLTDEQNLEEITNKHQKSLNIETGPVAKFIYIKTENNFYVMLIAHHLVIDSVSWRIIFEDLQNIYSQLNQNKKVVKLSKTTSFSYWVNSLKRYVESKDFYNQLEFWKEQKHLQLFMDNGIIKSSCNTEKSAENLLMHVDSELTELLVTESLKSLKAEINEVLISTFIRTYSIWQGKRKVCLTLENHGRENISDEIDLSRTVGWFTSLYPVVFDLKNSVSALESLVIVKEQIRKIPQNGISFGVSKYLVNNSDLPHLSAISFNYLGKFNIAQEEKALFKVIEKNKGIERAEDNLRPFEFDFVCSIVNGRLNLNIIYDQKIFTEKEIKYFSNTFIDELRLVLNQTKKNEEVYSPTDFKEIELNKEELNSIFNELNEDFENE